MTESASPPHGRVRNRENSTRTKARRRALDILFESDLRQRPASETLADRIGLGEPPVRPFTITIVQGYLEHADEIDSALASSLGTGWTLERMNRIDRNLARIALFEIAHTDTPTPVAIKEAVDLAAELSTDDSPAFVNAVLAQAATQLRTTPASGQDAPTEDPTGDANQE